MLFSEIYGNYYRTVAHILQRAVQGRLDHQSLNRIVQEEAFGESSLIIPDALLNGKWGLLTKDYRTMLKNEPTLPLTGLEKRWLKAILLDVRIQLFGPDMTGLEKVEPLFRQEWLVYYDRYTDGDSFADPQYQQNFRCILEALRLGMQVEVSFTDSKANHHRVAVSPQYLEYSEKDNRFRLIGESYRRLMINLARIDQCRLLDKKAYFLGNCADREAVLVFTLTDERKALERALLHFSHLQKETKRLDEEHYQVTLHYDKQDETEILIRILSFGPRIKVIAPADFCAKLRQRIDRQVQLFNSLIAL